MAKNKIAPANEIEVKTKIFTWNFEKSVAKIKPKVESWKSLTVEIAEELYIAREHLNGQIGQRKDPTADDYIEFTWTDYCDAIGISRRTANNWLTAFIPADQSETGEAYLMSQEELKAIRAEQAEAQFNAREARLAHFFKTGIRTDDWTPADETELTLRLEAERLSEVKKLWQEDQAKKIKPSRDYFAELIDGSDDLRKFAFKKSEHNATQLKIFDTVDTYLRSFVEPQDRLTAAYNLSVKLKEMTNYYAELDVRASETKAFEKEMME
ncbi:MAG: hypothetical protein P1P64_03365 [Treponemataceae bacterium]